jgi:hypothetical protein
VCEVRSDVEIEISVDESRLAGVMCWYVVCDKVNARMNGGVGCRCQEYPGKRQKVTLSLSEEVVHSGERAQAH